MLQKKSPEIRMSYVTCIEHHFHLRNLPLVDKIVLLCLEGVLVCRTRHRRTFSVTIKVERQCPKGLQLGCGEQFPMSKLSDVP